MRLKDKVNSGHSIHQRHWPGYRSGMRERRSQSLHGRRNLERAKARADEMNAAGGNVKYVYNDATKEETYVTMIEEVIEQEGHIDVLVNNFGSSNPKKDLGIANTDPEVFIKNGKYQSEERIYRKPDGCQVYGGTWRRKHHQHLIRRRTDTRYLSDCLWNQQSGN